MCWTARRVASDSRNFWSAVSAGSVTRTVAQPQKAIKATQARPTAALRRFIGIPSLSRPFSGQFDRKYETPVGYGTGKIAPPAKSPAAARQNDVKSFLA